MIEIDLLFKLLQNSYLDWFPHLQGFGSPFVFLIVFLQQNKHSYFDKSESYKTDRIRIQKQNYRWFKGCISYFLIRQLTNWHGIRGLEANLFVQFIYSQNAWFGYIRKNKQNSQNENILWFSRYLWAFVNFIYFVSSRSFLWINLV